MCGPKDVDLPFSGYNETKSLRSSVPLREGHFVKKGIGKAYARFRRENTTPIIGGYLPAAVGGGDRAAKRAAFGHPP